MRQKAGRIKRRYTTLRLSEQDILIAEEAASLLSLNRSEFIREAIQKHGLATIKKFSRKSDG
jgi:predicted DNA binding CopG/RHH family protein